MAKTKTEERKEKKDKKRSESEGVSKPKKEKKEKKSSDAGLSKAILDNLEDLANKENVTVGDAAMADVEGAQKLLLAALVPFANPLADEKQGKKVLKGVKKSAKNKTLKRGVKEVVKALRKSPETTFDPATCPVGVVVLAADISPMDVISHIPVLCEEHGIPYIYVPSRAELGAAGATKRPTSVVMVSAEKKAGKGGEDGDSKEEWEESYGDLVKVVVKAGRDVRI